MGNINRDCIIELLLEQPQYNKKFEILPGKPIQFFKHDKNQTIYIIVKGWTEGTLKMAIKNTWNGSEETLTLCSLIIQQYQATTSAI